MNLESVVGSLCHYAWECRCNSLSRAIDTDFVIELVPRKSCRHQTVSGLRRHDVRSKQNSPFADAAPNGESPVSTCARNEARPWRGRLSCLRSGEHSHRHAALSPEMPNKTNVLEIKSIALSPNRNQMPGGAGVGLDLFAQPFHHIVDRAVIRPAMLARARHR